MQWFMSYRVNREKNSAKINTAVSLHNYMLYSVLLLSTGKIKFYIVIGHVLPDSSLASGGFP